METPMRDSLLDLMPNPDDYDDIDDYFEAVDAFDLGNFKSTNLATASKALEVIRKGSKGSEIEVRPDRVVSPFTNYQRPVASPKMEVAVPFETDGGVVMPPLPEHKCDLPVPVETKKGKWGDEFANDTRDVIVEGFSNDSVFECICGEKWYLRIQKVPFHASKYDPQYAYGWHKIRWFNFNRLLDLRRRKEK